MFFCKNNSFNITQNGPEIVNIINNTDETREVSVFSTLPEYGREELRAFIPPRTSLPVYWYDNEPLVGRQVRIRVWVSDPRPNNPNRSCALDFPIGSTVYVSSILSRGNCI